MRVCILLLMFCFVAFPFAVKADFTVYNIASFYEDAAISAGNNLSYVEEFENNNLAFGDQVLLPVDGVLEFGTPLFGAGGLGFPNGLGTDLITITPFPGNLQNTWGVEQTDASGDSELIFGLGIQIELSDENTTAFAIDIDPILPGIDLNFEVYDTANELVASGLMNSQFNFFGVVSDNGEAIGRVVFGTPDDPAISTFDSVQLWQTNSIPEPSTTVGLAAIFAISLLRRKNVG